MKNNNAVSKWLFSACIFLLVMVLPASTASGKAAIAHPFDNSVLLMISSQMRLDGEVQSALLSGGRVLALSSQAADGNEIDVLLQLYADQIAKLRASDDYDPDLEAKLIGQLEDKVDALHRHAQELDASRSRRRGGLFGFLGRAAKSLGRATGWLMGKAMDGAGDIAEFAIEDVAPQVLKEALQNGAPLNAALVRRVARELLINRVADAIARDRQKRVERLAEVDTDPAADATWEADFMEAFDEGDQGQASQPAESSGGSSGGGSGGNSGPDIVTYDFTYADTIQSRVQSFTAEMYWQAVCSSRIRPFFDAAGHLEFDRAAMTASGWVEAREHSVEYKSDTGEEWYNLNMYFRVTFTDLPVVPGDHSSVAVQFQGFGDGTATIGGTMLCGKPDSVNGGITFYTASDQAANNNPVPIVIRIYTPGYTIGGTPATLTIHTSEDVESANGLYYRFNFSLDQPIDVPQP